jgi:Protein of unknown function (DUF3105)
VSISSPQTGGSRRPSTRPAAGAKKATPAASKSTTPTKSGGKGGGRPPVTPVKVRQGRNWGSVTLSAIVALVAVGIVGFGVYEVFKSTETWKDQANSIPGIVNYFKTDPGLVKSGQHAYGHIDYKQSPPVAGPHNYNWQRCQGDVYPAQIANEHAVHALEHGAVWITYRPDLPKDQVDKLAAKVRGNDFMFMSPYPGMDHKISLQAWGYQLKLDSADDKRIDQFIKALRQNDTQEPGAACSTASGNYITSTGTTPHDLGSPAPGAS